MIKIYFHRNFIKEFKKLPKPIKNKLVKLEKIFIQNPFNQSLHTKKLRTKYLPPLYAFRISREYRVIFRFVAKDEVDFLLVKHRKDIYKDT